MKTVFDDNTELFCSYFTVGWRETQMVAEHDYEAEV